jgi:diguanylate cyclase (GGDEF)-like protein
LKGETLGDKKFSELFGLPGIVSVLVLPIGTEEDGLDGALVLFQQEDQVPLSKEALEALEQVPALVTAACSRAGVLEHALEIATTDELTGSLNRRGFYDRFDGEMDRARRNQTAMCFALIDIDHFKMVNDTYGHVIGDQVLKALAQAMQKNIRKSDILCRYGGEEFALLLPETTLHDAHELLERLRKRIARTAFETSCGPLKISFSAGLQRISTDKDLSKPAMNVIRDTLASVDEGLYQAKQNGRNCVVLLD